MRPIKVIANIVAIGAVLLVVLGLFQDVSAVIVVWDGGGTNSNWSTANNWHPNQTPIDGDIVRFDGSTRLTPNNNITGLDALAIRFRANAGVFVVGGQEFGINSGGIQNNSSNTQTINNDISVLVSQTWTANTADLVIGGEITRPSSALAWDLTVNGAFDTTFTGNARFTGASRRAIHKEGTGTLVLDGSSFRFRDWFINAGTLRLAASNQIESVGFDFDIDGGTFDIGSFDEAINIVTLLSGMITGTTGVLEAGQFSSGGLGADSGTIDAIVGGNNFSKFGTGTVNLNRSNVYTGATSISDGTLNIGASDAIPSASSVTVDGTLNLFNFNVALGSLAGSGIVNRGFGTLTIGANDTSTEFSGVLGGTAGLTKVGNGTLTLSGNNTYLGTTTISGGALSINNDANLSLSNDSIVIDGGELATTETFSMNRTVTLGAGGGPIDVDAQTVLTLTGAVNGSGELVKRGFGTLVLGGKKKYSGGTRITRGSVRIGSDTNLGAAGTPVALEGGLLETIVNLTFSAARSVSTTSGGFDVNARTTLTVNNVITGSTLSKQGGGILVLGGANTYGGSTIIRDGTLRLGASQRLADTSEISIGNTSESAVLDLGAFNETVAAVELINGSITGTGVLTASSFEVHEGNVNVVLAGSGGLTKRLLTSSLSNLGTVLLRQVNTYTGDTLIEAGTLQTGTNNTIPDTSNLTVGGFSSFPATLDLGPLSETVGAVTLKSGSITGSGVLTGNSYELQSGAVNVALGGSAALVKTTDGTVVLSGSNTYTGGTTIQEGVLSISSDQNLGSGVFVINGGTLESTGTFVTLRRLTLGSPESGIAVTSGHELTSSGSLIGQGALVKRGEGILTLNTATIFGRPNKNTYLGSTRIEGGILRLRGTNQIPDLSAVSINTGALLELVSSDETIGSLAGTGEVNLRSNTLLVGNDGTPTEYGGVLSGLGGLTKIGTGILTLSGPNTYTGSTAINAGTLTLGVSNVLADSTAVTVDQQAALIADGLEETIGSLAGEGAVTLGGGALAIGGDNSSTTYAGQVDGGGSLAKIGTGVLTMTGENSYSGPTSVLEGALSIDQDTNLGAATGAVTLDGGSLHTTASFTTNRDVTLGPGTGTFIVSAGTTLTALGTLDGSGNLRKRGTGTLILAGEYGHGGQTFINTGTLQAVNGYLLPGGAIDISPAGELLVSGAVNRIVTGTGTITADGLLLLGVQASASGVDFEGTVNVGGNLVQMMGLGQARVGGIDMTDGGRFTTLNQDVGSELIAGGMVNATGNVFIDGRFVNNGLVNGPIGIDEVITFTDDVSGAGNYTGNILFTQGFSPGNSPGGVSIDGDVELENTAQLYIELGGTIAGVQYDQLTITGNLAADGTLDVQLIDGFAPQVGDTFKVLEFGSVTGRFSQVVLPRLVSGLFFDDRSLLTTGTVSVVPEPGSATWAVVLGLIALRRRRVA